MKSLSDHINEQLGMTLGFTADDELCANYIRILRDGFGSENTEYHDLDLWMSLDPEYRKYAIEVSEFTGAIDIESDTFDIYKEVKVDDLMPQICDVVSNAEGGTKPIDSDWGNYVLSYKGHEPLWLPDLDGVDWGEYEWVVNPRARWNNQVLRVGLEWIIDNNEDQFAIRNASAYRSLVEYTGWEIYRKGKHVAGKKKP